MRFAPEFLDEIRARLPISSVVGARVTFDHKKSNASRGDFWACCPFHGEKTPSFHCDDGRGRYHCFGCGVSGDHFRFLTELEGASFVEAVERLAAEAGLAMPARDERAEKQAAERQSLYEVLELAAAFFAATLKGPVAAAARDYLRGREVAPTLINRFRLGFASESRNALKEHLVARGVGLEAMGRSGLVVSGEDVAVPYDRFRNRIIFPIQDVKGRIVGFGGRAMEAGARAKYLNSPETELFHKGEMLYNLGMARQALQEKVRQNRAGGKPNDGDKGEVAPASLFVVEGYMDVIALARAGIGQAVAPLGTALTEAQLQLLWRTCGVPVLCFDGDEAGLRAAYRALDRALPLLKAGQSLRFVLLPQGKDPDDIVRAGGHAAISSLLAEARPLVDMLWSRETQGQRFDTPEARALLEKNLRNAAFLIGDESLRHYYLQELRARTRALFRPPFTPSRGREGYQRGHNAERGGWQRGERQWGDGKAVASGLSDSPMVKRDGLLIHQRDAAILAMFINHPALLYKGTGTVDEADDYFEQFSHLDFANAQMRELHHTMLDVVAQWQPDDGVAMRQLLCARGQEKILAEIEALLRRTGMRSAFTEAPFEDAKAALKQALYLHFHAHNLHKRLREIEQELLERPDTDMFAMLRDICAELERANATEALIDGFGDWQTARKAMVPSK